MYAPTRTELQDAPPAASGAAIAKHDELLRRGLCGALAIVLAIFMGMIWAILVKCGGRFIYPLDDPYIHLALARNIAHGHYGLNPHEASAPSSSILWPLLLAPFSFTRYFEYAPLAINLVLTLLTTSCLFACFAGCLKRPALAATLAVATVIASNAIGVALTGMEHSLQMWLTVLVAYGLIQVNRGHHAPPSLAVALVLGPLVRYENMAVTLCACVYLLFAGRKDLAFIGLLLPAIGIAGFSLFLKSQGLGLLPSSVIAKTPMVAALGAGPSSFVVPTQVQNMMGSIAWTMLNTLVTTLPQRLATHFGLFAILAVLGAFTLKPAKSVRLWITFGLILLLQLVFGRIGWFQRYEVYLYPFGLAMLVYFRRKALNAELSVPRQAIRFAVIVLFLAVMGVESLQTAYDTPLASACVYRQQYQMMRFVRDYYRKPVAVNDLGEVSFGSGQYVLDLWGLGSQEALGARLSSSGSTEWLGHVTERKNVGLAIIYAYLFPRLPDQWRAVGKMELHVPLKAVAGPTVYFYATHPGDEVRIAALLWQFGTTLPPGATMLIRPDLQRAARA